SPGDLKEDLIHSLQKYVEVDEPEPEVPLIGAPGGTVDADDTEVAVDRMTEEELLKGLEGLAPPDERPEPTEPHAEVWWRGRGSGAGWFASKLVKLARPSRAFFVAFASPHFDGAGCNARAEAQCNFRNIRPQRCCAKRHRRAGKLT